MIKLTTTQARAVASKIRERILDHNAKVRKQLEEDYKNSDDYKNKQREIHEMVVTIWQTQLKVGAHYGITNRSYTTQHMYNEEDIQKTEENLCLDIAKQYVDKHDETKYPPSEDQLVTDLIFESLTSEGIEDLMNKFIEPYL